MQLNKLESLRAKKAEIEQALAEKRKQIARRIQAEKAKAAKAERRKNTRRKIVLGGLVLRAAQAGKVSLPELIADAPERDRALFNTWVPGGDWTPNAKTVAAMQDPVDIDVPDGAAGLIKALNT